MEYIKFLKSKKILLAAVGVVIVAGITGFYFYSQKLPTYTLVINPTQLLPFVSHEQARKTVCDKMKGQIFDEICQKEFDSVGKNDAKKIGTMFSLLKKIENDRGIDDYERSLLAQAVFASLPTKDSPLAQQSGFPALLIKLKSFISGKNIAYAKEASNDEGMGEDAFKEMMSNDLTEVISNVPEGDNAWTINVSVSKYGWVNGKRQPIYSEEYVASYNPYPGVSTENKAQWEQFDLTHIKSRVGSRATSQAMYSGSLKEGSGEMIGYSFTMGSWNSKPYGTDSVLVVAEVGPPEEYYDNTHHFTEGNYKGDDLLANLLSAVKMPSHERPAKDSKKKTDLSEKIAQTAWGTVDDSETAYESYFWLHLQNPSLFSNFWDIYSIKTGSFGEALREKPTGEPVDLRVYFSSPGVKAYYKGIKEAGANIPSLDEFLNNIDQYQANLNLAKPEEKPQPSPEDRPTYVDPQVQEFDRWLKECANRPLPKTRAELDVREKEDSNPSSPCYNPNL